MTSLLANGTGTELGNKRFLFDDHGNHDSVLWERLVCRVMKDYGCRRHLAEQIMDQAIGFLYVIALNPGKTFSPAPLPDIGWHTFLLYTREYAAFCRRVAGRYIHHSPFDNPDGAGEAAAECPECTARHMREAGIRVVDGMWLPGSPKKRLRLRLPR